MSGKGNCYDNAAVETFFKTIKAELIWRQSLANATGKLRWQSSNTSTASTIRAEGTQLWAGKAPSLSKGKWLKRALGAALKRDRPSLNQIIEWRGQPQAIRVDNGPEYVNGKLMEWAEKRNVRQEYIQAGKPQQNAYIERYNRSVRGEWLG